MNNEKNISRTPLDVNVKLEDGYLIFTRNDGGADYEIYDIQVDKFRQPDQIANMRSKNWFTGPVELECNSLINGE